MSISERFSGAVHTTPEAPISTLQVDLLQDSEALLADYRKIVDDSLLLFHLIRVPSSLSQDIGDKGWEVVRVVRKVLEVHSPECGCVRNQANP